MNTGRRGFAAIFALMLVALVAGALLAVTALMTSDVRRSTRGAVDAQLRQLLHAGSVNALQRLRDDGQLPDAPFEVPLPPALVNGDAIVRVSHEGTPTDATISAVVLAKLMDRDMSQRVTFERVDDAWRVRSVELR